MTRLPSVGGDNGEWGQILNDYLSQSHNPDGTLKTDSVGAPQLKPAAVVGASIADGAVATAKLADGAVSTAKMAGLGQANGVATLDSSSLVPAAQIPMAAIAGSTELLATIANAPSDVGARAGRYDSRRSLYLPVGVIMPRKTQGKMALALTGTAVDAKVVCIGDSETGGYGGAPGTIDMPVMLRNLIGARWPAGSGLVTANNNNGGTGSPADSRWTFDSNWTIAGGAYGSGNIQLHRTCTVAGAVATYMSTDSGSVVDIYTFGNSGPISYSIDGADAVTYTPAGANKIEVITVTGLENITHTVTITTTRATATYLLGAAVRHGSGVSIAGFGFYGALSSDWKPAIWYNAYQDLISYAPSMAIIQLGVNDAIHGQTTVEYSESMTAIVRGLQGAGIEVALVVSVSPNVEQRGLDAALWSSFRTVMYDLADTFKVPLVDLTDRFGPNTTAVANGVMYSDHLHPNGAGYADSAATIYHALFA